MNPFKRHKSRHRDLQLSATIDLEASGNKRPTISIKAYSGCIMHVSAWGPVCVDLVGLAVPEDVPLLCDHENKLGSLLGSGAPLVRDGQLFVEGALADCTAAAEVIRLAKSGVPLSASVGLSVAEARTIAAGEVVQVNGRSIESDESFSLVSKATLKEISVVPIGADSGATVDIAAKAILGDSHVDKQEQERRAKVRELTADYSSIQASAIDEGWTPEQTELAVLREKDRVRQLEDLRASRPAMVRTARAGGDRADSKILEAAVALSLGANDTALAKKAGEQVVEAAYPLRCLGLQELVARTAALEGRELPRFRADATGWLKAAFSTTNVPNVLSNVANKQLLDAFDSVESAWRDIAKIGSLKDFKATTRVRLGADATFEKVGPGGEIKHGSLDDQTFPIQADTFGRMFSITRQDIINDDLSALADVPKQLGVGAGENLNEEIWTLWLDTVAAGAFWTAARGNFDDGADSALDVDGLTAAEILFSALEKPNGKPLGLAPSILLVPSDLRAAAWQLCNSLELRNTTASTEYVTRNPHAGNYKPVTSSYLRNSSFHASASTTAWWLLANPNRLASIEVAFLNGQQTPTVEQAEADFNTLGIQFRGYFDFGVALLDHRASLLMAGA